MPTLDRSIEDRFQHKIVTESGRVMRSMFGHMTLACGNSGNQAEGTADWANRQNLFYNIPPPSLPPENESHPSSPS